MKQTINLNSPAGNVFNLMGIMSTLIQENKLSTEHLDAFNKKCFSLHSYDDIVAECKKELELINKISVDQYEIIETDTYQLQ